MFLFRCGALEFRATVQAESQRERFELFVILDGTGHIHWQGAPLAYQRGQCWFIPASLGNFSVQPERSTSLIRTLFRICSVFVLSSAKPLSPKPSLLNRFLLSTETHGNRSTDSARGNPGRRPRTRFGPGAARERPKQLLNIIGKQTMLEQTVARLRP